MKKLLTYLKHSKKLFSKYNAAPEYVTFFVTNKCNCRCRHCFYWKELNSCKDELTLDEIEKLSRNMKEFLFLLITGGEPFIRDDLPEIVNIFYKNNKILKLSLMTNGFFTEKIIKVVKKILAESRRLNIGVYLSLDGIGDDHDRIRDVNGMFQKTLVTFYELEKLKKDNPRLNTIIAITYSAYNQDKIFKVYDYIKNKLHPDSINIPLIRGDPADKSAKDVDLANYRVAMNRIKKDFISGDIGGIRDGIVSNFVIGSKFIATDLAVKTAKENRFRTDCYAGIINAVIYPNGDVYPCELLDRKIGNLRDYSYNFTELWHSKEAKSIRRYIKYSKCSCIHLCNLLPNVIFNPRYIPRIFWNIARLKIRR